MNYTAFFQSNIQQLKIGPSGQATGLCPLHEDHIPSFSCNLEEGVWNRRLMRQGEGRRNSIYLYQLASSVSGSLDLSICVGPEIQKRKQDLITENPKIYSGPGDFPFSDSGPQDSNPSFSPSQEPLVEGPKNFTPVELGGVLEDF